MADFDERRELGTRKPTGQVNDWWITVNLMFDTLSNGTVLYGNFKDTPGLASETSENSDFNYKTGIWRVDFLEHIVEFEDCYVRLGAPQSLDKALARFTSPGTGQTSKENK